MSSKVVLSPQAKAVLRQAMASQDIELKAGHNAFVVKCAVCGENVYIVKYHKGTHGEQLDGRPQVIFPCGHKPESAEIRSIEVSIDE